MHSGCYVVKGMETMQATCNSGMCGKCVAMTLTYLLGHVRMCHLLACGLLQQQLHSSLGLLLGANGQLLATPVHSIHEPLHQTWLLGQALPAGGLPGHQLHHHISSCQLDAWRFTLQHLHQEGQDNQPPDGALLLSCEL